MAATSAKTTGATMKADAALPATAKGRRRPGQSSKAGKGFRDSTASKLASPVKLDTPFSAAVRQSIKQVRSELAAQNAIGAGLRLRDYAKIYLASPRERIGIIREGVPALQLVDIGFDMGVTKESLFSTLQFPRATINRKIAKNDVLPPEFSERMVGLQKLIGQVEVMVEQSGNPENFNAAHWLAQWLNEPLPALGNERPADFMDTVEGQELISNLLLQMQTGAYA